MAWEDYNSLVVGWSLTVLLVLRIGHDAFVWLNKHTYTRSYIQPSEHEPSRVRAGALASLVLTLCVIHTVARIGFSARSADDHMFVIFITTYTSPLLNVPHCFFGILAGQMARQWKFPRRFQRLSVVAVDVISLAWFALVFAGGARGSFYVLALHDVVLPIWLFGLLYASSSVSYRFLSLSWFQATSPYTMALYVMHQPAILLVREWVCPTVEPKACRYHEYRCQLAPLHYGLLLPLCIFLSIACERVAHSIARVARKEWAKCDGREGNERTAML